MLCQSYARKYVFASQSWLLQEMHFIHLHFTVSTAHTNQRIEAQLSNQINKLVWFNCAFLNTVYKLETLSFRMNTLFFLWYAHSLRKIKFKFKINNVESYQRESNLCHSYPKLHVLLNKYLQYSHPITTIKLDTKSLLLIFLSYSSFFAYPYRLGKPVLQAAPML